jgi:NAD(P)-dependent dehydrogenase (short-subunit alcohol dehydrogenase family)
VLGANAALQSTEKVIRIEDYMSKVWFVTGANSGIGAGIAKAALQAGVRVVATGRNMDKLRAAFADEDEQNLALVRLDVSPPAHG